MANRFYKKYQNNFLIYIKLRKAYSNIIYDSKFNRNSFIINFKIQPTKESNLYDVSIIQTNDLNPVIQINYNENFRFDENIEPPHVYIYNKNKCAICLIRYKYFTEKNYFDLIPWTSEWLLYYELWVITGKWLGGGEHHEKKTKKIDEK